MHPARHTPVTDFRRSMASRVHSSSAWEVTMGSFERGLTIVLFITGILALFRRREKHTDIQETGGNGGNPSGIGLIELRRPRADT